MKVPFKKDKDIANIFDYLYWRGDLALNAAPFNEVDALILARLAYVPFEASGMAEATDARTLRDVLEELLALPEIEALVLYREDLNLMRALSASARFRNMGLARYVNQFDPETQKQFAAITVELEPERHFVAFRGTDDTLVGWKESFNMCFTCPVPAQKSALDYLEAVAADTTGPLLMGGHSKGGNVAMYAASFAAPATRARIERVYNFDGPGFDKAIVERPAYQEMRGRMNTYVPQSSIVGLLLEHEEDFTIVRSSRRLNLLQHNIYYWSIDRDRLEYLDHVTSGSRFINRTLKGWLADLDVEQRENVIDALYAVLANTDAQTLRDLDDRRVKSAIRIVTSLGDLDEDTRKLIYEALLILFRNMKDNIRRLDPAPEQD